MKISESTPTFQSFCLPSLQHFASRTSHLHQADLAAPSPTVDNTLPLFRHFAFMDQGEISNSTSKTGRLAARQSPAVSSHIESLQPPVATPQLSASQPPSIPAQDAVLLNESGAVVLDEPNEADNAQSRTANARADVPTSLERATELLRLALLDNHSCKSILKALKVTGISNAKIGTKKKVIAAKMVQRKSSIHSALDFVNVLEDPEHGRTSVSHPLQLLRATFVKTSKSSDGAESIIWNRGDIPIFDNGDVLVREPVIEQELPETVDANLRAGAQPPTREPDFGASEFCCILHVLADTRITAARAQLMEPRTREELDGEPCEPWTDNIAPLFNDVSFKPQALSLFSGGVTRYDIASINPALRPYEREGGILKRK